MENHNVKSSGGETMKDETMNAMATRNPLDMPLLPSEREEETL